MKQSNCWEIMKCGRGPGGDKAKDSGVCPAASDKSSNDINGGKNAGRLCWAIAGTFCEGKVQGDFAKKLVSCTTCEVFKRVKEEEGIENFVMLKKSQAYRIYSK